MTGLPLLLAALMAPGAPPVADTVIAMRSGDRVVVREVSGELTIVGWDRDELEVRSLDHQGSAGARRSGSELRVLGADRKGRDRDVELVLQVPRWASVEVRGGSLDVTARGTGPLSVNTASGDVAVEGATGAVSVRSMSGEVEIRGVRGNVVASSQTDDVRVEDVLGDVEAYSNAGEIELLEIDAVRVSAETQAGDIDFTGAISEGGDYAFFVHAGDATIAIPRSADARVSVSTFDGDFESDFPVRLDRFTGGREFEFTLGGGGARLRIQVFDGEIRLVERR